MNIDYREITKTVFKLAMNYDDRISRPTTERIDAWTDLFAGKIWPDEAQSAVLDHYATVPCGVLMPGDVIGYCQRQPPWSSIDHATDWILTFGVQNPYSGAIEAYSGIQEPVIAIPESVPRCGEKQYLIEQLSAWAKPRLDELAHAIVAKQFRPWWTNQ